MLVSSVAVADVDTAQNVNLDSNAAPWLVNSGEILPELVFKSDTMAASALPELSSSVDNSQNIHFRPIFDQTSGSCVQASSVGYTFTYEMAAARNLDASIEENQYPEHFTWNFLNGGIAAGSRQHEGWKIIKDNGIPNVNVYGGMASAEPYIDWMSGYDKYYQGMFNRVDGYYSIKVSTPEGINNMKRWMTSHDDGSAVGGIVSFSANSGGDISILEEGTPFAGEKILTKFGTKGGHGMTLVGYNDEIMVDLNGDGQFTNDIDINDDGIVDLKDWEIGAAKLANTSGLNYGQNGFIWLSYSVFGYDSTDLEGPVGITGQQVEVVKVKKDYQPRMTFKINMTHESREKISLRAGVASSVDATAPELTMDFSVFNYQGGNHPMRGSSSEPIEFGLDVSPLLDMIGTENAKKFFLIVDEKDANDNSAGEVISLSVIDYRNGEVEYVGATNTSIINDSVTYIPVDTYAACEQFNATNQQHENAGRAYSNTEITGQICFGTFCWGGTQTTTWYAVGSDQNLGTNASQTVSLIETSSNYYESGSCPAGNAPTIDDVQYTVDASTVTFTGTASDIDGDLSLVLLNIEGVEDSIVCEGTTNFTCIWQASFSQEGENTINLVAVDSTGIRSEFAGPYDIYIQKQNFPTIDSYDFSVSGKTVTFTGTASDADGDLDRVILTAAGESITCQGTSYFTCVWQAPKGGLHNIGISGFDVRNQGNGISNIMVLVTVQGEGQAPIASVTNSSVSNEMLYVEAEITDADDNLDYVYIETPAKFKKCSLADTSASCEVFVGDLESGEHIVKLFAFDLKGNISNIVEIPVVIEKAPTIDSIEYSVDGYTVTFTGTASDADGNLDRVELHSFTQVMACEGTTNFTCVWTAETSGTYPLGIIAIDSSGIRSDYAGPFQVEVGVENHAPTIDSHQYSVEGNTVTFTGTASDIDGNLDKIEIFGAGDEYVCEGTSNFTCTWDAPQAGTYSLSIRAVDTLNRASDTVGPFEIVIEGENQAPTIDSHQYSIDGNTLTFTGTASDVDGNLNRVELRYSNEVILCQGTANFTCTWTADSAGTYTVGIVAIDSLGASSEFAGPYDVVIEEQGQCITDTNYNHVADGRAYVGGMANLYAYGVGSDDSLGLYGSQYYSTTTSLKETSAGVWVLVDSCQ